jgi:hypothetical protein
VEHPDNVVASDKGQGVDIEADRSLTRPASRASSTGKKLFMGGFPKFHQVFQLGMESIMAASANPKNGDFVVAEGASEFHQN